VTTLEPGTRVTADVVLVRHLGAGGMGTVWVAAHEKLGTQVVVKFLAAALAGDDEAKARFSREVASMVQVKSPHVVQTLDHGIFDDVPFIVMELLEGEDLSARIRRGGALAPPEVLHVVEGVAAALTKAHEQAIVHRDIKPANIFLCDAEPRPFIKLLDFGVAKRLADHTMTGTFAFLGTPSYMSPEQVRGARVDLRSDLWSLAVVAYYALTGVRAFQGDSLASLTHSILRARVERATAVRPDLPPSIDAWFTRALAREPERRFSSAREMADSLAQALDARAPRVVGLRSDASPPRAAAGSSEADATWTGSVPRARAWAEPTRSNGTVVEVVEAASPPRHGSAGSTLGPAELHDERHSLTRRVGPPSLALGALALALVGAAAFVGHSVPAAESLPTAESLAPPAAPAPVSPSASSVSESVPLSPLSPLSPTAPAQVPAAATEPTEASTAGVPTKKSPPRRPRASAPRAPTGASRAGEDDIGF
jgi:serine/threonine protein kinase